MKNDIVLFKDGKLELKVKISPDQDTVWLNRNQMAELFDRDVKTIGKHINNALKEELDGDEVVAKFATTTQHGAMKDKTQTHMVDYYNLDMIISVGYRVKSSRGIAFRKWANKILRDYMIQGYAVNQNRLNALNKVIEIQTKMLANAMNTEEMDILHVINLYSNALETLDDYDHQCLKKPKGNQPVSMLTYDEVRKMINQMEYSDKSEVFGVEKEPGKLEGILAAVNQNVFGKDVYPSIEEKAANLLYFVIKDHPFADGCKRIAASLFLEFLNRNDALLQEGKKRISDGTLVALTLLIAESKPEEKEVMITIAMKCME